MRNRFAAATIYAGHYAHHAKKAVVNATKHVGEHKSELACIATTAVVVGLGARVNGFKAGYKFAQNA